jgi:hypothetical protein
VSTLLFSQRQSYGGTDSLVTIGPVRHRDASRNEDHMVASMVYKTGLARF